MSDPAIVRRQRPGHQTRMPDVAAVFDAAPTADPLIGNYVLLRQEDVVLAYQGAGEQFLLEAVGVGDGKMAQLTPTGRLDVGSPQRFQHCAVVACDLDGDHLDEIACAVNEGGTLRLVVARNQDPAKGARSLSMAGAPVAIGSFGGGRIGLAGGDFVVAGGTAGVIAATLALAWSDKSGVVQIEIWGTDGRLSPQRIAAASGPQAIAGNLSLAAADVDGDGRSEVVLAWQGSADHAGHDLFVSVYRLDATGKKLSGGPVRAIGALGGYASFELVGGQFSSTSTAEQVALAWADAKQQPNAQILTVDAGWQPKPAGDAYLDPAHPVTDSMRVRLAAGDLDLDGVDELVLGSVGTQDDHPAVLFLHVLKPDNQLNLVLPGPHAIGAIGGAPNTAFAAVDCALAIGELGPGRLLGVVVGALGTKGLGALAGKAELALGVVEVDPSLALPPVPTIGSLTAALIVPDAAEDPRLDLTLGLTLGDFSGNSVRVGPPQHFTCEQVNGVLAIVNAPPAEANVNFDGTAALTFTNQKERQTSLNVSVTKDWGWSDDTGVNLGLGALGHLNASLTRTYGKGFSKTKDHMTTLTTSLKTTLWEDDVVILSVTDYEVWEYPLFDDASGDAKGHLLIVFPDPGGIRTLPLAGTSEYMDYFPDHQLGTALSYPELPPADVARAIATNYTLDVGAVQETVSYSWSNSTTTSQQTTSRIGLVTHESASFSPSFNFLGGVSIGLNASFTGNYDKSAMSTHSITYTDQTSIQIMYQALQDRTAEYLVSPYVYWSSEGGFLVVDYTVAAKDTGYWQTTWGKPSANLNHLYANDPNITGDDTSRTRSIFFEKQKDGSIRITVRVANYSLAETLGIAVTLYDGPPDAPTPKPIGKPYVIPKLSSRSRTLVRQTWRPADPDTQRRIYAVLAPTSGGSAIAPVQGWTPWPPTADLHAAARDACCGPVLMPSDQRPPAPQPAG